MGNTPISRASEVSRIATCAGCNTPAVCRGRIQHGEETGCYKNAPMAGQEAQAASPDLSVAVKADDGKLRLDLLPIGPMEAIAEVLTFGAKKYADHNWRKGFKWSRLVGALLRHTFAWARGEKCDPETGLSHLAHAGCCIMFLLEHEQRKLGEDDRYVS